MNEILDKANDCKKRFKLNDASVLYKQYLQEKPDDVKATANLGICEMLLGRYRDALASFDKVLSAGRDDIVSVYRAAIAVLLGEKYDLAPIKNNEEAPSFFMDVIEAVVDAKKYNDGLRMFEVFMAELNSAEWFGEADNQYRVIVLIVELGDIETAEALCRNLLAHTEFSWQGQAAYGRILEAKGDADGAKKAYDEAYRRGGECSARFMGDVKKAKFRMLNNGTWTPRL